MKVYNCFEDLREQFSGDNCFICEGERFDLVSYEHFENKTTIHGVNLINTEYGLIVRIYGVKNIIQYKYRVF